MNDPRPQPLVPDPDFVESIESGLTESFADYCKRIADPPAIPEGGPNA